MIGFPLSREWRGVYSPGFSPAMLEAIIAVSCLLAGLTGIGVGWWLRARVAGGVEAELRAARDGEMVARAKLESMEKNVENERDVRAQMENAFKAMAADIANHNSETFLKQAGQQFKSLRESSEQDLDEKKKLIDKSLSGMNEKLEFIHKQSTELKSSIDTSRKTTETLNENTTRLREILSSSQKRGQWGERMVEDILRFVGLMEKVHYTKQEPLESGQRPDFTFMLPQEKKLNMDVKFPLARYEGYLSAADDGGRAREKDLFLKAVRGHVDSVCGREYINPAEGTLEYVMLFIPNESIYGFINREDSGLVDYALERRVLLCSPLTLYAMLSLIHQATRNFTMNERASEVMALVGRFRDQWKKYVAQMDKMGTQIERLSATFQNLATTRTHMLEKPLDKIETIALPAARDEAEAPE